jgi:hypothetical protein
MTRDDFFQKLEEVSADIENVPLTRRAAIRLRNLPPPVVSDEAERELQAIMQAMNEPY